MKRPLLILVIVINVLSAFTQQDCQDMIFTDDGNRIIFNCCIQDVKNGNVVIYSKEGKVASTKAVAITKDGQFVELVKETQQVEMNYIQQFGDDILYKGHNYRYYEEIYFRARTRQAFGVVMTFLGAGLEIAGFVIISKEYVTEEELNRGSAYLLLGGLCANAGVPLWISGSVKKANNKQAMGEIKRYKDLTFGPNEHGVGFTLRF